MSIQEFLQAEDITQSVLLYHQAIYIGKRKQGDEVAVLYQLEAFYVEITYLKYRYHISSLQCFTTPDILDHYPETVCIEELV